jgi:hypothetical protein
MTRLLCYIGFHRYASRFNDQGERYLECTGCNKYKDYGGGGPGGAMGTSGFGT